MAKRGHLPVHMGAEEFSQLLAALHALAPRYCLEWGSGGSTRAVLEQCPFIQRYVSIEHEQSWYERVRAQVTDPRLALHPPARSPAAATIPADLPAPALGRTRGTGSIRAAALHRPACRARRLLRLRADRWQGGPRRAD